MGESADCEQNLETKTCTVGATTERKDGKKTKSMSKGK